MLDPENAVFERRGKILNKVHFGILFHKVLDCVESSKDIVLGRLVFGVFLNNLKFNSSKHHIKRLKYKHLLDSRKTVVSVLQSPRFRF